MFARFSAMYGRLFTDMWAGTHAEQVKATWAEDLGAFSGPQIAWALEQARVSCELPPTLPRFRQLCAQSPRALPPAVPLPALSYEQLRRRAGALPRPLHGPAGGDGRAWARRILAQPQGLPAASIKLAREALGPTQDVATH